MQLYYLRLMGSVIQLKKQINNSYLDLKNSVEDKLVLVEEKIKLGEQSVFLAQVNIGNGGSIYSKIGDIFAIVCFMFLLLIGFQTWRKYS